MPLAAAMPLRAIALPLIFSLILRDATLDGCRCLLPAHDAIHITLRCFEAMFFIIACHYAAIDYCFSILLIRLLLTLIAAFTALLIISPIRYIS